MKLDDQHTQWLRQLHEQATRARDVDTILAILLAEDLGQLSDKKGPATIPAPTAALVPDTIAHCGGCGNKYTRAQVMQLPFVGRMDKDEDGDQQLALHNCTCAMPGTFSVVSPVPPSKEQVCAAIKARVHEKYPQLAARGRRA